VFPSVAYFRQTDYPASEGVLASLLVEQHQTGAIALDHGERF
jgi:hypothetical protein